MPTDADAYLATVARLEPDIVPIDAAGGWASIAISLKRIADAMERFEAKLTAPALYEIVKAMQTLADADEPRHRAAQDQAAHHRDAAGAYEPTHKGTPR